MYIEPNSTIMILRNVPLDTTYDHTIFFENATQQYNYFASMVKPNKTFTRQSYQRVKRGWMRINCVADELYDCNYIMFQNTGYGNKWFYAFLKTVEYINNAVSEIEFEIDVMQTWFFDYNLDQCFVEREHTATDEEFEHLQEENVNIGDEYVANFPSGYDPSATPNPYIFDMNDMDVCILYNHVTTGTTPGTVISRTINKIYTPSGVIAGIPATRPDLVDLELNEYAEGDIICVYQYPDFLGDASTTTPAIVYWQIPMNRNLDGYTAIRNKKLLNYPYNFLLVSNNSGQVAEFRWEDWETGSVGGFKIAGVFVSTPAVICFPIMYKHISDAYDDGLVFSNFPQCAWGGDTFKAWWAQNKASFVTGTISSAVSSLVGTVNSAKAAKTPQSQNAAVASGIVDLAGNVANAMAKIQDIKNTPSQTYGQTQTDSLNPGLGRVQFNFYRLSIKREYAMMLDDYFDRFGYACKRNKVPNRNVRPVWTYTKTIGCTISGSIPADDAKRICSIYDNGITFWKYMTGMSVGNYSQNNRPISPTRDGDDNEQG